MFAGRLLRSHVRRRCRAYGQSPAVKNDVLDRIVYNSVLHSKKLAQHWHEMRERNKNQKLVEMKCDVEPVSLQFLDGYSEQVETGVPELAEEPKFKPYSLPYSIVNKVEHNENGQKLEEDNEDNEINYDRKSMYSRVFLVCFFKRLIRSYNPVIFRRAERVDDQKLDE